MFGLNLTAHTRVQLPASAFPERAHSYVCDNCGRDVTKHLRPGQAHVWAPMARERFSCECGRVYLTGAREWDHLGDWERANRVSQVIGLGILLSVPSSILAVALYFILRAAIGSHVVITTVSVTLAVGPFALFQIGFWPGVLASMWRTRLSSRRSTPST